MSRTATTKTQPKNNVVVATKGLWGEFKDFILRGNVVELAVGLTVGTAFTRVVNSMVNNLVMPIISIFLRGETFRDLYINLGDKEYASLADALADGANVLRYGQLLADLLDFLIIAVVIFAIIKFMNRAKRQFEAEEAVAETEKAQKDSKLKASAKKKAKK